MASAKKWGTITLVTLGVGTTATLWLLAKRRESQYSTAFYRDTKIPYEECRNWCQQESQCARAVVRKRRLGENIREYGCACGECT
jgi:hypothetical protein